MLAAARICRASFAAGRTILVNPSQPVGFPSSCKTSLLRSNLIKNFSSDGRDPFSRTSRRRRTIKEIISEPTQGTPFAIGKAAVAGGAVVGLGALCFYGLGLANKPGAIDRSIMWPDYVKERIHSTYTYLGASLAVTAASAVASFRSPTIIRFMSKGSFMAIAATMAAMIGSGIVLHSIPYEPGFGVKQMAWMAHTGLIGMVIAPLCMMAGPLALTAAWYTGGIVGGLSAVAACAPSDRFLNWGGPLAIGFGVVFMSCIGSMFVPATTTLGAGLYSICMYGGLLLFSGFLLYDTQRIIKKAETYPLYASVPFDPINASMSVYSDTINIFIRILSIMMSSNNGGKRR